MALHFSLYRPQEMVDVVAEAQDFVLPTGIQVMYMNMSTWVRAADILCALCALLLVALMVTSTAQCFTTHTTLATINNPSMTSVTLQELGNSIVNAGWDTTQNWQHQVRLSVVLHCF